MKSPPTASRAGAVTTAIRTLSALPEKSARIYPDAILPSMLWRTIPKKDCSTALAGKRISKTKQSAAWETPSFALRRTRCVSCVQFVFLGAGIFLSAGKQPSCLRQSKLLCEISAERICEELCKALCGRWVSQTFALKEVWGQIFPELDVLGDEIQRLPEDAFLRLIWLYHSQGKRAKDVLVRLKAPKAESKREEALWEILQNIPKPYWISKMFKCL